MEMVELRAGLCNPAGMEVVASILAAIGLAACAGLRAFLPLFAAGLAARVTDWPLIPALDWLASDPALIVFGVASVIEMTADKVPIVDHGLDVAHTFVGPAAGAIVAIIPWFRVDVPPAYAVALGIMTGATVAGGVHALSATARLKSTVTTAGIANPVLSFLEDGLAAMWALVAILAPLLILLVVAFFAWIVLRLRPARRRA